MGALPRAYLANIIYTLVGEPFKQWVEQRVNNRHDQRRQDQSLIEMDSEIAAIFNRSNATSGKYPPFAIIRAFAPVPGLFVS